MNMKTVFKDGRVLRFWIAALSLFLGGSWAAGRLPAEVLRQSSPGGTRITFLQDEPRRPAVPPDSDAEDDAQPREPAPDESRPGPRRADPFADVRAARIPRRQSTRLASVPNMFGDIFGTVGTLMIQEGNTSPNTVEFELPMAGGSRRVKIGENNRPLPTDRVFVMYQHFHNALALRADPSTPASSFDESVDRLTLGLEKTFFDGDWSVEMRVPFVNAYNLNIDTGEPPPFDQFRLQGGEFGNLAFALKHLVHQTDETALAIGLGLDTPTGSSFKGRTFGTDFRIHNDALHLLPFIGGTYAPRGNWFFNAFAQLDIAANGNRIEIVDDPDTGPGDLGVFTEQNLFYADFAAGYWLHRDPCACRLTGVAALAELHYTTSIQDTDFVGGDFGFNRFTLSNPANRFDVLNLSLGLHTEIANTTTIRVAGVLPLRDDPQERPFDAEFQLQVNRRF